MLVSFAFTEQVMKLLGHTMFRLMESQRLCNGVRFDGLCFIYEKVYAWLF